MGSKKLKQLFIDLKIQKKKDVKFLYYMMIMEYYVLEILEIVNNIKLMRLQKKS